MRAGSDVAWSQVRQFMQRTCGVVMSEEQSYLLDSRLGPVAKTHAFPTIEAYVDAACKGPRRSPPTLALIDAMTTHETQFFRDPTFWAYFEKEVMPKLIASLTPERRVRIWCAASSTGQEPYTIAMIIRERWPELVSRIEIVGSDVSELSLATAKEGAYTRLEVNRGISAPRLVKHFETSGTSVRIRPELRAMVRWEPINLLSPVAYPASNDIVLCRNVLIYFADLDRQDVLRRLLQAARIGGFLAVGTTERADGKSLAPGWYQRNAMG
jgi:chemotaxis protein methyltransferase CheR